MNITACLPQTQYVNCRNQMSNETQLECGKSLQVQKCYFGMTDSGVTLSDTPEIKPGS